MDSSTTDSAIYVLRPPAAPECLRKYASIFRDLRLQALRESPESFTEGYEDVASRPAAFWQDFIKHHVGLIHIAFGISPLSVPPTSNKAKVASQSDFIMDAGLPLSMAVNSGPVTQERFLSLPNSRVPLNRPDSEEMRFHGGMLFHIARMRGTQRGHLFENLTLDRDEWLLEQLLSADNDPPPVARFRGNVKTGPQQRKLLAFYVSAGWYIAGTQTWRSNLLAEGGEAAVQAAECRGDDMEEVSIVVEKIFTVPQLEWQIRKNKRILAQPGARL